MIIDQIEMKEWKTRSDIYAELAMRGIHISDRCFRKDIEKFNARYENGFSDEYIVHDNERGYKKTKDVKEIQDSAADLRKRGINMLMKYWSVKKRISKNQLQQLDLEELFNVI